MYPGQVNQTPLLDTGLNLGSLFTGRKAHIC